MKHKLTVHAGDRDRTIFVPEGKSLHSALLSNGYFISSPCGGNGRCGKCKIIASGSFSPPYGNLSYESEILACKAYPCGDCDVFLPAAKRSSPKKQAAGKKNLGIAFDVGTTGISATLCDLDAKCALSSLTVKNVQTAYGADVITRLTHDSTILSDILISQINNIIEELTADPSEIMKITFAANTVMSHYLARLSPCGLATFPLKVADTFGRTYSPIDLGLICKKAEVFIFPSLAPFVGGDISAGLLASGILKKNKTALLLDIGTNGEAALWRDGTLFVTSAAAGPAFEGAELSCGIQATAGAVISFDGKDFTTLGNIAPRGISGSGACDILAELLHAGTITRGGELLPPDEAPAFGERLSIRNGEVCFDISEDVFLSASDIRKLQLAKAAIRAAVSLLLKRSGTSLSDIDEFFLSGAFGTALSPESVEKIGLIPKELLRLCNPIENSSLKGAIIALSDEDRDILSSVREKVSLVELSADAEFEEEFLNFIPM